jgi:hypothetical protein
MNDNTPLVVAYYLNGPNIKGYRLESFDFKMGAFGKVFLYVGLWGSVKMLGYKSMLLPLLAERLVSTIANLAD